jgi:hypothetical protein
MESLKEELERSTQAFNVYRARAHTALKKTASEQHTFEAQLQVGHFHLSAPGVAGLRLMGVVVQELRSEVARVEADKAKLKEKLERKLDDTSKQLAEARDQASGPPGW